jgi:general secretion pathway protein C
MGTSRFPRESTQQAPAGGRLVAWLPRLAIAAAIGVGAWLATEWFWYFAELRATKTPGVATSKARVDMRAAAEALAGTRLFGIEKQAPTAAQVTSLNIKLKGVFAGDPAKPAFAIVNTGSRDEFALAGRELMPGVKLDSVHATHVLVNRNGMLERVNLEERSLASLGGPRPSPVLMAPRSISPAAPGMAPQMGTPPGVPAPPRGVPGSPQGPGAQQPLSITPQSMQNFGRIGVKGGGVTVEAAPPGSMLASLGLQPGDVIRSVNGQAVTSEADLARVYQQSANAESVQAEVVRGGQTFPVQVPLKR